MFPPSSAGSSPQAENKAHGSIDRVNDSLGGIFSPHGHMQSSRGFTVKSPFHADPSSLNGDEVSSQRRCNSNSSLSPFHSKLSMELDHVPTFDDRGRFTAVEDLNVGVEIVFQSQKGKQGDVGTSQYNPAAWPRQIYKPRVEASNDIFNKPPALTRREDPVLDRQRSPRSNTMAYLSHRHLETYSPQQTAHTLGSRVSTASPPSQQAIKEENMNSYAVVNSELDQTSLDATRIPLHRYDSNTLNQQSSMVSMSTLCEDVAVCQSYSEIIPAHNRPSPHQLLRSQPVEAASMHPWPASQLEQLPLDYSQHHIQSSDGQVCFPSSQAPESRNYHSFPDASYQNMNGTNQRASHYMSNSPDTLSGLMIHMGISSPQMTSSISEPSLSVPPMSCSAPTMESAYNPMSYIHQSNIRYHSPISMPPSTCPTPALPNRSTNGYPLQQQSPKTRQQHPPQNRRANHSRKQASFSGQPTSRVTKGISPSASVTTINSSPRHHATGANHGRNSSACNSKTSKNVSFKVFTPKDGKELLKGVSKSGSAKSKDKKERAAIEQQKKAERDLLEAAHNAVAASGGNVEFFNNHFARMTQQGLIS